MKLKKFIISLVAAITLAPSVFWNQTTKADTINDLAMQNSYVGVTYLYKMLAMKNITYNKFYAENKIVYRNKKPEGVVIHETATPGATAENEAIYFNREWMNMYAYVHAFVDHSEVIQMMTPDYGVWGAGPMANDRFVQVELCEETTRDNFAKSVNNDAIWVAHILHRYNLKPTNATHTGKGTIWSHAAVSKFLGGTDHGDPDGYFAKWGYSMDQFFDLVKHYYDLQGANVHNNSTNQVKIKTKTEIKTSPKKETTKKTTTKKTTTKKSVKKTEKVVIKMPKAKRGYKIVVHDAAIYNYKGRYQKKPTKKAGSQVKILGTKIIKKRKFYHIGTNQYLVASNLDGSLRKLKHNAYIYDTLGISNGKSVLKAKSSVRTYGGVVSILGVKYYQISPTQFVKLGNF